MRHLEREEVLPDLDNHGTSSNNLQLSENKYEEVPSSAYR
jgi:hypothetical protein